MRVDVYLVYPDGDQRTSGLDSPDDIQKKYNKIIEGTNIKLIPCCNNRTKNLLRYNRYKLDVDKLPVFICCYQDQRWLLKWEDLDLAKKLSQDLT